MIGNESKNIVVTQIKNILQTGKKEDRDINLKILRGQLVQTGKVPSKEINKLVSGRIDIDSLDVNYLCLIYKTLKEFNDELQPIENFFTPIEIENSEKFITDKINSCYPLVFNKVVQTTESGKEFKFFITAQQLEDLSSNGLLQVVRGLQRESETIYYRGKMECHVAYDESVSRKIADSILKREYHPTDDIKVQLMEDDVANYYCDYIYDGDTLTINSGTIVLLDGQHRTRGNEYAVSQCPDINLIYSISFSIGTEEFGQSIIEQHERRQPIKRQVLESYKPTEENDIFKIFSSNKNISKEFKFVDTSDAEQRGAGFIIRSDMIKSIKRYFKPADLKTKEQREVAKWLVKFFDTFYIHYEDDFNDFQNVRKTKWNVRSYAYEGFVYMAKRLYDLDITDDERLEYAEAIFSNLNFDIKQIGSTNKSREVKNIIEVVVNEYVK